jgi:hypothetical protein
MAGLDPWKYAAKTNTEQAHQRALFMWANMACNFGLSAANDPASYTVKGAAKLLFDEFNDKIPELKWLHAVHNQGHGDKIRGANAKAEGVKAGVFDVMLPVSRYAGLIAHRQIKEKSGWPTAVPETKQAYCGLYIELKRPKSKRGAAGAASQDQLDFKKFVENQGYKAKIIIGWELAKDEILSYLGIETT